LGDVESNVVAAAEVANGDQPSFAYPSVYIPVENYLPENIPTFYSDGMIVVHTANEFVLSFLLTDFPLAAGKED